MKRIYILSIFLLWSVLSFAATRYWVGGGTNSNWNSSPTSNWSATDGGANGASVPGASDDVIFNGNGATANTASTISAIITVLSLTFTSGYTQTVTVNATPTIAGNFTDNTAHSWAGSSSMTISDNSTITSGGKTWPNNVTFSGTAKTRTLVGNWVISGSLSISGATSNTINWTTNETISCNGLTAPAFAMGAGSAKIILTGGTWSGSGAVSNDIDIQGNVTISGSVAFNTKTLTYVSGTVTTTGSTLTIAASTTLNTNGITWNNITISGIATLTLNSLLSVTGNLTINSSVAATFAGASGFTVGTLTCSHTSATTQTFNDGVTYTITTALTAKDSRNGSILLFTSDDATNKAIITLQQGATCNVLASFTRIDASGGRPIPTFNGTITNCLNIVEKHDFGTSKH